ERHLLILVVGIEGGGVGPQPALKPFRLGAELVRRREFGVERRSHSLGEAPRAAVEAAAPEAAGRAGEDERIGRERIVGGYTPLRRAPALLLPDVEAGQRCPRGSAFGDWCGFAKADDVEILALVRPAHTARQVEAVGHLPCFLG